MEASWARTLGVRGSTFWQISSENSASIRRCLDNGEYQEILTQLQEQGIDITNLTPGDLGSLIDQNALDGVLPEFLERSKDNAA